jgi:cellobiose transport system substrate-binding protein
MRSKWLAVPAALALLLSACGDGGNGSDTADGGQSTDGGDVADGDREPVTLSMWQFNGVNLDDLVAQYEEQNPHVTVEIQTTEHGDHHDALISALAAGGGPDIAVIEVAFINEMADQYQVWHNLYDYGARDVEGLYLDWKIEQAQNVEGAHLIGLPTDVGGLAMAYRHDLFAEAGLPTDRDEVSALWGDSWADWIEVGQQYTEATGRGFVDNESNLWNAVVNQDPNTYFDSDGNPIFDESEQVQYAWDVVVDAIEAGVVAEVPAWSAEWEAGMSDGSFAVLTAPAWMMGYIQNVAPGTEGNWDLADIPEGGGNWGGSHLGIPRASDHPEEAYALIEWLLSPENQLYQFTEHGQFPSIPELFDTEEVRSFSNPFFNDAPVGQIYAENAERVVAQNTGPNYDAIDTEFVDGLGRIADGVESPDEAWESALTNIRSQLGL